MNDFPSNGRLDQGNVEDESGTIDSMRLFGMGEFDSEHGVVLKDWSAQDFANIYVRFRPHLISHARKFLREESQAEEVVQDAFLYLMTALPELDSELGVLRFLKWKTKMLCLDAIRLSQSGLSGRLVPLPDDLCDDIEVQDSLERADDAAIIRLALARLNPRHREALIATLYEGKTHEEVAEQMGVGDNALRQLLFRARASFKRALVGEAEVEGKSISEILHIASRRSAAGVKAVTGISLSLVLLFGLVQLSIPKSEGLAELASSEFPRSSAFGTYSRSFPPHSDDSDDQTTGEQLSLSQIPVQPEAEFVSASSAGVQSNSKQESFSEFDDAELVSDGFTVGSRSAASYAALDQEINDSLSVFTQDVLVTTSEVDTQTKVLSFALGLGDGRVFAQLSQEDPLQVERIWVTFTSISDQELVAAPKIYFQSYSLDSDVSTTYVAATDFMVGDVEGAYDSVASTTSILFRAGLLISIEESTLTLKNADQPRRLHVTAELRLPQTSTP